MVNSGDLPRAGRGRWLPSAAIVLLAFGLYANSIGNGYAVDDDRIVEGKPQTTRGIAAIPEILTTNYFYENGKGASFRPLVRILYALEVQLIGANPHAHHAIQIGFYALTGLAVYGLVLALLPHGPPLLALVTALLFVAHPVHTEVVNDLKSRDELLAFLFGLLSALACLRYYRSGARGPMILGAGLFLAALCCKESGQQYLAAVPLVAWFGGPWHGPRMAKLVASLLAATILYWGYYFVVLDREHILYMATSTAEYSFMEHPLMFVEDPSVRYGTAFLSIGFYLCLLLFPHPLSFFYGLGAVPLVPITSPEAWIPALAYAGIAWVGWRGLRRRTILSFAALWFLVTSAMLTNLIVPMSGIVADRCIYSVSLGFCLALAFALTHGFANASSRSVRLGSGLITILLLAGYSAKTAWRTPTRESRLTGDALRESGGLQVRTSEILLAMARARLILGDEQGARNDARRALSSCREEVPSALPPGIDLETVPAAAAIDAVTRIIGDPDE